MIIANFHESYNFLSKLQISEIKFTKKIPENKILSIHIAHNEGNYFATSDTIKKIKRQ